MKKVEAILDNILIGNSFILSYQLGIFDLLYNEKTGLSIHELSQKLNIKLRPLQALISVSSCLELTIYKNNKFYLTDFAIKCLFTKGEEYYRDVLDLILENQEILSLSSLNKIVLENNYSSNKHNSSSLFIDTILEEERAKKFVHSMNNKSLYPAKAIANIIELNQYSTLLDIGGCSGIFAYEFCKRFTNLRSIIMDLPNICRIIEHEYKDHFNSQINIFHGNMWYDDYPSADVHFYSDILHDWSREKNMFLLDKTYRSLPLNGKIVINEKLLNNDKTGPIESVVYNLKMLLWTEGHQYSQDELHEMLKSTGFKNVTTINYYKTWYVTEGYKI
ncbi:MAG: hypothetical protein H6910_06680 [Rickettsiaceae bacterium]|nr:hypothetical protein [Rickettsiaceae bacterium]